MGGLGAMAYAARHPGMFTGGRLLQRACCTPATRATRARVRRSSRTCCATSARTQTPCGATRGSHATSGPRTTPSTWPPGCPGSACTSPSATASPARSTDRQPAGTPADRAGPVPPEHSRSWSGCAGSASPSGRPLRPGHPQLALLAAGAAPVAALLLEALQRPAAAPTSPTPQHSTPPHPSDPAHHTERLLAAARVALVALTALVLAISLGRQPRQGGPSGDALACAPASSQGWRTSGGQGRAGPVVKLVMVVLCVLWVIPTVGIIVTSFRTAEAVNSSAGGRSSPPP